MHHYTAHVTARDGIVRPHDLTAPDLQAARHKALQIARQRYGAGFTFTVRVAA